MPRAAIDRLGETLRAIDRAHVGGRPSGAGYHLPGSARLAVLSRGVDLSEMGLARHGTAHEHAVEVRGRRGAHGGGRRRPQGGMAEAPNRRGDVECPRRHRLHRAAAEDRRCSKVRRPSRRSRSPRASANAAAAQVAIASRAQGPNLTIVQREAGILDGSRTRRCGGCGRPGGSSAGGRRRRNAAADARAARSARCSRPARRRRGRSGAALRSAPERLPRGRGRRRCSSSKPRIARDREAPAFAPASAASAARSIPARRGSAGAAAASRRSRRRCARMLDRARSRDRTTSDASCPERPARSPAIGSRRTRSRRRGRRSRSRRFLRRRASPVSTEEASSLRSVLAASDQEFGATAGFSEPDPELGRDPACRRTAAATERHAGDEPGFGRCRVVAAARASMSRIAVAIPAYEAVHSVGSVVSRTRALIAGRAGHRRRLPRRHRPKRPARPAPRCTRFRKTAARARRCTPPSHPVRAGVHDASSPSTPTASTCPRRFRACWSWPRQRRLGAGHPRPPLRRRWARFAVSATGCRPAPSRGRPASRSPTCRPAFVSIRMSSSSAPDFPESGFEAESAVVVRAVRLRPSRRDHARFALGTADGRGTSHYRPVSDSVRIAAGVLRARYVSPDMSISLVTGGSRGIGRAIVAAMLAEGWTVAFTYRSDESAAREIEVASAGRARAFQLDLRDRDRPGDLVREVEAVDRPARRAGQQRRIETRVAPRDDARSRLGRGHGREPRRRLSLLPSRAAADDASTPRQHRQRLVALRGVRRRRPDGLRGIQGRRCSG